MTSRGWVLCLALLALALGAPGVRADRKKLTPTKEWSGSVADEGARKEAPDCITSRKGLEKLWKAWKVAGKVPEVDFKKDLVVVVTGGGSKLRLAGVTLDEKGDLRVFGMGTLDLAPGFRYVLASVSREGVKSVNGKKLPRE
jgi:hypothetical protein